MDKNDIRSFLKQTEKIVKDLGIKAGDLAKAVEKDAAYGTKAGIIKVEQLALENDRNKLINQFGQRAYGLMKKKQVTHKSLADLFEKILKIDNKIKGKKLTLAKLKRKHQTKKK